MGSKETCTTETQANIDRVGAVREGFLEEVAFGLCPVNRLVNHSIFWICLIVSFWCHLAYFSTSSISYEFKLGSRGLRFRLNILLSILDRRFCITSGTIQRLIIPLIGGVRFDHLLQLWSPDLSTEKGYYPPLLGRVIPGVVSSACATLPFSNNHSPCGPASVKGLSRVAVPSCLPTSSV